MSIEHSLKQALREFEERFANVLACFQAKEVYQAMTSLALLEHGGLPQNVLADLNNGNTQSHMKFMSQVFLKLLHRGALHGFQVIDPITVEADRELDDMEVEAGEKSAPPKKDPKAAQVTAIDECAADYRSMDGAHFKMKWMDLPARRQVYEAACAAGRI